MEQSALTAEKSSTEQHLPETKQYRLTSEELFVKALESENKFLRFYTQDELNEARQLYPLGAVNIEYVIKRFTDAIDKIANPEAKANAVKEFKLTEKILRTPVKPEPLRFVDINAGVWDRLTRVPEVPKVFNKKAEVINARINDYVKQLPKNDSGKRPLVIALANALSPGGFPTYRAQEEAIMAVTDALLRMPIAYPNHPYGHPDYFKEPGLSRLGYCYAIVKVIQYAFTNTNASEPILEALPNLFDLAFVAAPDFRNTKDIDREEYVRFIAAMARFTGELALSLESSELIEGALGCGAFENNPFLVSAIFKCVFEEERYKPLMEKYVIAYNKNANVNKKVANLVEIFAYINSEASPEEVKLIMQNARPHDDLEVLQRIETKEDVKAYINQLKNIKPAKTKQNKTSSDVGVLTKLLSGITKALTSEEPEKGITRHIVAGLKKKYSIKGNFFLGLNAEKDLVLGFESIETCAVMLKNIQISLKISDLQLAENFNPTIIEMAEKDKTAFGNFKYYLKCDNAVMDDVLSHGLGIKGNNIVDFKRVNNIVDESIVKSSQEKLPEGYALNITINERKKFLVEVIDNDSKKVTLTAEGASDLLDEKFFEVFNKKTPTV